MSNNNTNQQAEFNSRSYRLHALDLDPSMVERIDGEILHTACAKRDSVVAVGCYDHWLLNHTLYMNEGLLPMVRLVREVNGAAGVSDERSDKELAGLIIHSIGLWDFPQPRGFWARMAFVVRFTYRVHEVRDRIRRMASDRGKPLLPYVHQPV